MREPRKFSIGQLLQMDAAFVIPDYQRGYDWKGDAQVKDLFVDLFSCIESEHSNMLFLGSMIFDISRNEKENIIEVIDGQQRLTTLLICLVAARQFAKDHLENEKLVSRVHSFIQNSDPLLDEEHDRLNASDTIGDTFSRIMQKDWEGDFPSPILARDGKKQVAVKRQNSKIRPIYRFAYEQIHDFCKEDPDKKFKTLLNQIVASSYIINIEIEDKSEAFEIFERTNARGKGLEIADLLKNFLFSKEKEIEDADVKEEWADIVDNAGSSILRMLKYFWISRRGYISARDLYRKLRYYAHEVGIPDFLSELKEFSMFYKAYYSKDSALLKEWLTSAGFDKNQMMMNEFHRIVVVLRLFSVTQVIPLIFSSMKALEKSEEGTKGSKRLLTMLRYIESYHFANNKVCNRIGNETEDIYAKFSQDAFFRNNLGFCQELIDVLASQVASEAEFLASFPALTYLNPTDRHVIRYVFDKVENVSIKDGQRIDLLDTESLEKGLKPSFDIEHLVAQSEASNDEEADEWIHQIGNLLVIPKQINGILGNASFKQKMDMLKTPSDYDNNIKHIPTYLQFFVQQNGQKSEWGPDDVSDRTTQLAKLSHKAATQHYKY